MRAVLDLPANQHCQSTPASRLKRVGLVVLIRLQAQKVFHNFPLLRTFNTGELCRDRSPLTFVNYFLANSCSGAGIKRRQRRRRRGPVVVQAAAAPRSSGAISHGK